MKFSIKWAQQYSNYDLESIPVEDLLASIGEQLGAVEEVVDLGQKYAGIYIVRVESVTKHGDSDKLNVCLVNDGKAVNGAERNKDGLTQVVCGAPNVKAGMLAVWIPPGATVPSTIGSDPFTLESKKLRGELSHGMLASPKELDLSDDHQGLLEVDTNHPEAKPGQAFADVYDLNDVIIELENKMFTHRPDCFGMLGVTRELAGITNQEFISPDWYLDSSQTVKNGFTSSNEVADQVPRFAVQVIKDVEIKPSSQQVQSSLSRVGSNPINNIVDLTNYYMHLTAQPTHAFDYDKVAKLCGKDVTIFPRMAKEGEELALLNGKTIKLTTKDIVIATDKQPIALAGVMGGSATEVDDNTKNVIIECANFNMYTIRRTSMHHGLFTDAVTRFNKGQSYRQNAVVLNKLCAEIIESAGGTLTDGYDSSPEYLAEHWPPIKVDVELINKRLGSDLVAGEIAKLLSDVEFQVDVSERAVAVAAPFWRTDIEISEDIVEEIGRLYGYDKLPIALPSRQITPAVKNQEIEFKNRLRQILSSAGANEVLTYSFVSERLITNSGQDPKQAYQLSNALSPELQYYRLTLTPSLLSKVHPNIKSGQDKFVLFEINKTHLKSQGVDNQGLPGELEMFSLVYAANDSRVEKGTGAAYFEAKKYLDYLATKLGTTFRYEPLTEKPSYEVARPFDWKRSALVSDHKTGNFLGIIGEYTSTIRKNLKLPVNTAGFELNYRSLNEVTSELATYRQLDKFPSTDKDITIDVPEGISYGLVKGYLEHITEELANKDGYSFSITDLDIYQKPKTKVKSITVRINIADSSKTLTTAQATEISDKVADFVKDNLAKNK
jgi:phenylalanyl-tRNA synthetase beta chain